MALLAHPVHSLLLLALLLAVVPCLAEARKHRGHPCSSPHREMLSCRHAGLSTVPPATRVRNLISLDLTDNSISNFGPETWKEYQWTETLILRNNDLQAVKSHSLEGLFLLKKLDLSGNNIKSIGDRAFEPLPFLQHLNLSGNQLTEIPSGAFHAWHGMQFLQELILSHNPLTVIADTAFFKLPSVTYLDLSATHVSPQTLLMFLQTAFQLETLKVPSDVSCCLCKERGPIKTLCRTIHFLCENLCSTSAAQCGAPMGSLSETLGEIVEAAESGQLKSSTVLYLKPKQIFLGDNGSTLFAVSQNQTNTMGHVSSQEESTAKSYSSQHLSSQESKAIDKLMVMLQDFEKTGWTGETERRKPYFLAEQWAGELKNKQSDAPSTLAVENIVPIQPLPAWHNVQKFPGVEEKKSSGRKPNQLYTGLNRPVLSRWEIAAALNLADNKATHRPHSAKEAAARSKSPVQMYERRPRDIRSQVQKNPLFHEVFGNVRAEEEARPREPEDLNRNQATLWDLRAKSRPAVSTMGEDTTGEGRSLPWGSWQQQEERSWLPKKAGGSHSPGRAPVPAQLLQARAGHHLRSQVPDGAVQTFISRVTGALSTDCSLPELRLPCARMVSKAGLLLRRLSEPQDSQAPSALAEQCVRQKKFFSGLAWQEPPAKNPVHSYSAVARIKLLAIIVTFIISFILFVTATYLIHVHFWQHLADAFQTQCPRMRRFFEKLRWEGLRNMFNCAFGEEDEELARTRNMFEHCFSACQTPHQNLPSLGAPPNDTREFPWFKRMMQIREEDTRPGRLHNSLGQRQNIPDAEAVENNPGKLQELGSVTS